MTSPPDAVPAPLPDAATLIVLTRLEAKVDVALAQHGADLSALSRDRDDHEKRLRAIEERRTVSPGGLWAAIGGGAALVLTVVNLWNALGLGA